MANSELDVVFVQPNVAEAVFQSLGNNIKAIEPPIWSGLLAKSMITKGFSADIIDAEALGLTVKETIYEIQVRNPRLVVMVVYGQQPSASTQNMHGASVVLKAMAEAGRQYKVVMVGTHISALPNRTLNEEATDFVCAGEGVKTIEGLLQIDMDDTSELKKVPGLWYKDGDEPILSMPEKLVHQNDLMQELPGMAWDLLPMSNYRASNWHCFDHINERQPYASLYTSLGCPFKCSFCCINAPFGGSSFRYWDPEFMISEFDILAEKYHVKNIKIADEMFVLKDKHFIELCKLLKERNYGFNIWAYSRIDSIKPKHLDALKDAGVNWLALGIESGSKYVRQGVTKGRFGEDDIYSIVKMIQDKGIRVIGNYIFGLPDDTYESMQETLDMSLELNCEMANFYSAMAYPGSALYKQAIENGWELPDTWLGYSQYAFETKPLPTEALSSGQVLGFRDRAFEVYFSDKNYLNSVKRKFGQETHDYILESSKKQLKRKYAVAPK